MSEENTKTTKTVACEVTAKLGDDYVTLSVTHWRHSKQLFRHTFMVQGRGNLYWTTESSTVRFKYVQHNHTTEETREIFIGPPMRIDRRDGDLRAQSVEEGFKAFLDVPVEAVSTASWLGTFDDTYMDNVKRMRDEMKEFAVWKKQRGDEMTAAFGDPKNLL